MVRRDIIRSSSTFSSNLHRHELRTLVAHSLAKLEILRRVELSSEAQ